jgi:hypothetical protein
MNTDMIVDRHPEESTNLLFKQETGSVLRCAFQVLNPCLSVSIRG